jgi:hypothetical protein
MNVRATDHAADGSGRDLLEDAGGIDVVDRDVAVHQHDLLIAGRPVLAENQALLPGHGAGRAALGAI